VSLPDLPDAQAIRDFLELHPNAGPAAIADTMCPGASAEDRTTVINRAKNVKGRLRSTKKDALPPAVDSNAGKSRKRGNKAIRPQAQRPRLESVPRPQDSDTDRASADPMPPVTVLHPEPPKALTRPTQPPTFDGTDVAELEGKTPYERRVWLLNQASRGILSGDPAAPAYQAAVTKVQQCIVSLEEIEAIEAAQRPKRSMADIMRELASRADDLPLHMLEPLVQAYLSRTKQTLSPMVAA
jgi:hypothetical protein